MEVNRQKTHEKGHGREESRPIVFARSTQTSFRWLKAGLDSEQLACHQPGQAKKAIYERITLQYRQHLSLASVLPRQCVVTRASRVRCIGDLT